MTAQLIDGNALSRQLRSNVAERALALKAKGVTVNADDQPRWLYPYGANAAPLDLKQRVKFGTLTFETTCGPLILRGLNAWVDETMLSTELKPRPKLIEPVS